MGPLDEDLLVKSDLRNLALHVDSHVLRLQVHIQGVGRHELWHFHVENKLGSVGALVKRKCVPALIDLSDMSFFRVHAGRLRLYYQSGKEQLI